ncbi:MAG: hypothetical protein ABUS49_03050 [Acidobacteriota bacterium]
MLNPLSYSLATPLASAAKAMLVVKLPEPGMVTTLAFYMGALGIILWCCRGRSKRSGL